MWLSEKNGVAQNNAANVGEVTIGGASAAVYTDAEHRRLGIFSPGGYVWRPQAGQDVLVIKCGECDICVAGAEQAEGPSEMAAGEVYIKSNGGAFVYLKSDGSIELYGNTVITGRVDIDGSLYLNGNAVS